MGMNIKLLVGGLLSIVIAIVLGAVSLVVLDRGEPSASSEIAPVAVAATAMDANNDPMDPISPHEADRRATLHNEAAEEERGEDDPAFVATPVVERIGDLGDPDALATRLFDMDLFTSEPLGKLVGVTPTEKVVVQEAEPEPADPEPVVVEALPPKPPAPVVTPDMELRGLLARGSRVYQDLMVIDASSAPQPVITFLKAE